MVFVTNIVGDVFIFIAIILGGIALIGAIVWIIWKKMKNRKENRSDPFKEGAGKKQDGSIVIQNPNQRGLSKISRDDWELNKPEMEKKVPIIIEAENDGQFQIKNPSALSKSEYRKDFREFQKKHEDNVRCSNVSQS